MRLEPLFCPECGEMARGTLETVSGVAEFELAQDGAVEYTGYTDVWWDEQRTLADEGGNIRLVCPKGHDWAARDTGGEEGPVMTQAGGRCPDCGDLPPGRGRGGPAGRDAAPRLPEPRVPVSRLSREGAPGGDGPAHLG